MMKPCATMGLALALTVLALAWAAPVAGEPEFSEANRLLFLEDQLTDTDEAQRYRYQLTRSATGSGEEDFTDEILMTARPAGNDGSKDVSFDYLSGTREQFMPDVAGARGNPIVMAFLQRDVTEMERLTGGHWRYFQKQIKLALENDSRVEPVTVRYAGVKVDAREITVTPYADDARQEMQPYRDKVYSFLLSEDVPGKVYSMRVRIPGQGGEPLIQESLVLVGVETLSAEQGER